MGVGGWASQALPLQKAAAEKVLAMLKVCVGWVGGGAVTTSLSKVDTGIPYQVAS